MKPMPFQQIHLDFHTSPYISDIGKQFDSDEFGRTLRSAHVRHVNLFGKCHHGWFYYPSKIGPMHPGLSFNLLGAQADACRKYGISFSVYTCVGWNEEYANTHPQCLEVSPDGILGWKKPFERGFYQWQTLCLNHEGYRETIRKELKEEYELFRPRGFWIDIIQPHACVCQSCRQKAVALGLDIRSPADRRRMARRAQIDYMRDVYTFLMDLDPGLQVYFNGFPYACDLADEAEYANANKRKYVTFMDIESLPSNEWGYTHFPISVNYVNKYDTHDIIMMNGKFHLAWGDFGTLRNTAALEYECFRAAANGAGVCIGDQLHPSGTLEKSAYERIGKVFGMLEATEKWCRGSKKIAQIGVYSTTRTSGAENNSVDPSVEGVYRVLTENRYQYDILDLTDPVDSYELLILPDCVYLTKEAAEKIDAYVAQGGKVLATGYSGADEENGRFLLGCIPAEYLGRGCTAPRYMDIRRGVFPALPEMKTIAYSGGARVRAREGAVVLAETVDSYFDRSEAHFCSHRQTPPRPEGSGEPCILARENVIYVSNELFKDIAEYGMKVYKDLLCALIHMLVPRPIVQCELPTWAEVTVRKLGDDLIVHILNYIVQRKCKQLDTVEESVPLLHRTIGIRTAYKPASVVMLPGEEPVPFTYENGYVNVTFPRLDGRTMIKIVHPK